MEIQNELAKELIEVDKKLRDLRRRACKQLRIHKDNIPPGRARRITMRRYSSSLGVIPTRTLARTLDETFRNMESEV